MFKYLGTLFQDPDGDPDEITFAGCLGLVVMCAAAVADIYHGKALDYSSFGTGIAAIVASVGGGKWARDWHRKGNDNAQ